MSRLFYLFAAVSLLAATAAYALTEKSFRAYVVSVDAGTKTIRFRVPDDATPPKWNEVAATWDDTTKWEDAPDKIYQRKAVDSNLVKKLQKDSKVYVQVSDRWSDEKNWWIQSLSTMPGDATVP